MNFFLYFTLLSFAFSSIKVSNFDNNKGKRQHLFLLILFLLEYLKYYNKKAYY